MQSKFIGIFMSSVAGLLIANAAAAVELQVGPRKVRILNPDVESQLSETLKNHLSLQNLTASESLHWLEDVQVNDRGDLQEMSVSSALKTTDAAGVSIDVHCDSIMALNSQNLDQPLWILDPRVPNNPSCVTINGKHPAFSWNFVSAEWYAHSGNVERMSFRPLYDAFDQYLAAVNLFTPSWTREAWILRVAADENLQVQRLWIFASALLDREASDIEKRADCHGEVSRNFLPTVMFGTKWSVEPGFTCRVQYYRFSESCFGPSPGDCEWEWEPCDGEACKAVVSVQTDPNEARQTSDQNTDENTNQVGIAAGVATAPTRACIQ